MMMMNILTDISGSDGGEYDDDSLLGCYDVESRKVDNARRNIPEDTHLSILTVR
jgi:hypothetical protein